MSLTSHEEIGRVGRVGQGCYDNPREDVRIVVRVVLVDFEQVALLWQRDRATRLSVEILQLTKHPI